MISNPTFSILVTTKDRITDLKFTLNKIKYLLDRSDVECVVFDDGSTDHTSEFIKKNYPNIILLHNQFSKGLIYCRNKMLNHTKADYAISLDDDAHFVSENVLQNIQNYFKTNPKCGVIAFRIFWGLLMPQNTYSMEVAMPVQGFVGCGHVWRMKAWHNVPNYPAWFVFYGEEDFAAFQLFKKDWEIHYLPEVLVHHRVDVKSRKQNFDYQIRLRRSLRSGWYLFFLFYPVQQIPKRMFYTLWIQIKNKILKGDIRAGLAVIQALFDVIINFSKLMNQSNRLSLKEFKKFQEIPNSNIYWSPENKIL